MRRRRGFKLTDLQAQILITVVVILMVVIAIQAVYIVYMKIRKSNVKFEIVELPAPKVEIPTPQSTVSTTEQSTLTQNSTPDVYVKEEFDYLKFVNESSIDLPSPPVSIFVVSGEEALKIIRTHETEFIISKIDDGTYVLLLKGDVKIPGLMAQRIAYGIYVVTYFNKELAEEKARDLRKEGYSAYVRHFVRKYTDYYAVVLGLFPTLESAQQYNAKLDWKEIMRIAGTKTKGYAGLVIK